MSAHILQNLLLWWKLGATPRGCAFFLVRRIPLIYVCSTLLPGSGPLGRIWLLQCNIDAHARALVKTARRLPLPNRGGRRPYRVQRPGVHGNARLASPPRKFGRFGYTCAACWQGSVGRVGRSTVRGGERMQAARSATFLNPGFTALILQY